MPKMSHLLIIHSQASPHYKQYNAALVLGVKTLKMHLLISETK